MSHTEGEAKTKWCPFARVAEPWQYADTLVKPVPVAAINRGSDGLMREPGPNCLCIASACMAWRWQPQGSVDNPLQRPGVGQSVKRVLGYCGLAGAATS